MSFWVSGVSSSPLEEIAEAVAAVPDAPAPWYQMCARPHSLSHPQPLPFVTCYGPAASHGTRLTEHGTVLALSWLCGAKAPDQPVAAARRYNSVRADIAESILTRAKAAGFGAIVLTVDSANKYGWRTEELESGYLIQHDARCALRPH